MYCGIRRMIQFQQRVPRPAVLPAIHRAEIRLQILNRIFTGQKNAGSAGIDRGNVDGDILCAAVRIHNGGPGLS